jgi:putative DNA primase/helicase
VQENIIQPLLGQSALMVQGGTTEAGIRQHLKQDARPVIFDEAESEDHSAQKRMKSVIELARQSSSDGSAEIVKGTSGGGGMAFRMRSMFLLGSVNVSLSQAADESRFTVVSLNQPNKTAAEIERFNEFSTMVGNTLTPERCAAIRARSYYLIPVIRKNAKTLAQAVAETLGSQRIGDQVGTLLAGAVSLSLDREITIEEARTWTAKINLDEAKESEEVSDEGMCLNAILQTQLIFEASQHRYQRTVSEVIMAAGGKRALSNDVYAEDCNAVLARHGLFVDGGWLIVSNTHNELKRMLRDTPWAAGWRRVLSRLPGAEVCPTPQRFAGSQTRAIRVPLDSFL